MVPGYKARIALALDAGVLLPFVQLIGHGHDIAHAGKGGEAFAYFFLQRKDALLHQAHEGGRTEDLGQRRHVVAGIQRRGYAAFRIGAAIGPFMDNTPFVINAEGSRRDLPLLA